MLLSVRPMAWWSRTQGLAEQPKKSVPKGIWTKCERCNATLYEADLDANFRVCSSCQHHFRMPTEARIEMMVDPGSWQEHDRELESGDPLGFRVDGKKYVDQLKGTTRKVGPGDAYRAGTATIGGITCEVGFFVFEFMGGSMGSVVGEKITRQFERARRPQAAGDPVLRLGRRAHAGGRAVAHADGEDERRAQRAARGARPVHLGAAPSDHRRRRRVGRDARRLIIAEPDALIGFAGPRVIEQTIRQQLPPGFQRSEFLLEHGMVDMVVPRKDLKPTLERSLRWFERGREPERRTGTVGDDVVELPQTD